MKFVWLEPIVSDPDGNAWQRVDVDGVRWRVRISAEVTEDQIPAWKIRERAEREIETKVRQGGDPEKVVVISTSMFIPPLP